MISSHRISSRRALSANHSILLLGCAALALAAGIYTGVRLLSGPGRTPYATHRGSKAVEEMNTRDVAAVRATLAEVSEMINADQIPQAGVAIRTLHDRFPDHPEVVKAYVEVLLHENKHADAYQTMLRYIELKPEDAPARFQAGMIANSLQKRSEAVEHFKSACAADKSNPQYPLYLGQMLARQRDWTQAKIYLAAAAALKPDQDIIWGTLGQIALEENSIEMARQYAHKAQTLAPDNLHWRVLQSRILRRDNQPDQAILILNALPEGDRWTPTVVNEVAICRALTGDFAGAAREHLDFLNRDTTATESAVAATRYFLQAGDLASAKQWLGFCQRANPDSPDVLALSEQVHKAESDQ